MPLLLLKDLPRYECLLEATKRFPELEPRAVEVYLHLLRTSDEVFDLVEKNLAGHHITPGRFMVLMLLWHDAEALPHCRTPASLADCAGVTRATMTGLIDTLERDGLVIRKPDPTDRRMMSVSLTPKGETLMKTALPGHMRIVTDLMAPLTAEEQKTFVALLRKIAAHADTLRDEGTAAPAFDGGT
ncbi:MarR family transcriptional regulator [Termitidicoccus mucosus]|uniref:HTH marR-type domain-containing protein n=1 Tax=Termitidicoccus mucosus TaxID=1184151 RepID=A0A178IG14_9BACT|nr:hypothetical protein AW736_21495 [Opitutaceae bacterium TSB47]